MDAWYLARAARHAAGPSSKAARQAAKTTGVAVKTVGVAVLVSAHGVCRGAADIPPPLHVEAEMFAAAAAAALVWVSTDEKPPWAHGFFALAFPTTTFSSPSVRLDMPRNLSVADT